MDTGDDGGVFFGIAHPVIHRLRINPLATANEKAALMVSFRAECNHGIKLGGLAGGEKSKEDPCQKSCAEGK